MKKSFLLTMVAIVAMLGCTKERPSDENGVGSELNYLSVNIANVPTTRASAGSFELGTDDENLITKIRFYFFDRNDNAVDVIAPASSGGAYTSYFDYTLQNDDEITSGSAGANVEETVNAIIVIDTRRGDNLPAKMMVVINPPATLGEFDTLEAMRSQTGDYGAATRGNFIITNSVYSDTQNNATGTKRFDAAVLESKNLCASEEAAKQNPVNVYVERVVAKVKVKTSLTATKTLNDGTILLYKVNGKTYGADANNVETKKDIYVKFLNWDLTATAETSHLVKKIQPGWAYNLFGTPSWNDYGNQRSYWAQNPSVLVLDYKKWSDHLLSNSIGNEYTYTYCQENAAPSENGVSPEDSKRTKLIVPACLVDETGAPIDLAEWKGFRDTKTDLISNVILNHPTVQSILKGGSALAAADLDFVPTTETTNRYQSFICLSTSVASDATFTINGTNATKDDVNNTLKALGYVKYWNKGYTYYYTDIEHFGTTNGNYGVVRNHIYNIDIESFSGLGTPIPNPDSTDDIIPEKPGNEETYIAAKINVLSWKVVNQDVNFN